MAEQLRGELARAVAKYFGTRGGSDSDISKVIVLDDAERAFPGYRRWATYLVSVTFAAEYSFAGVINTDAEIDKSAVTIDWFDVVLGAAMDVVILTGELLTAPLVLGGPTAPVFDMAPEQTPTSTGVRVGNVMAGVGHTATGGSGWGFFNNGTLRLLSPPNLPPFVIGPQRQWLIRGATVNTSLSISLGGRYYSAR
jgi:hypothetical protein